MRRVACRERSDWRRTAEAEGFVFHSPGGEPYWDETGYYAFTLKEIEEDLEAPTVELHQMGYEIVRRAIRDESILARLQIPQSAWDTIANSYNRREPSLYGRFDLAYDGRGPAKLLEYNADTPTSLYEAGYFQWGWLEQSIANGTLPKDADQFNSIHDKLIAALQRICGGEPLHLAAMSGEIEDRGTVGYIEDCARQAGLETSYIDLESIGLSGDGHFVDLDNRPIARLFKLYPWEWIFADEFAKAIPNSPTRFIEPAWKAILSNKGLLPLLWELAPNHPNLLQAYFETDTRKAALGPTYARKPLYSREGANVSLIRRGEVLDTDDGPYGAEGFVRQALVELPHFDGNYAVIGSWIIGEEPAGMGIREDKTPITKNTSRFLPHAIVG
jgi:glutathionylspermidine synthase